MNIIPQGAKAKKEPEADNWITPQYIIDAIDKFYNFEWFDPCPQNPTFNGLAIEWKDKNYINPPFSKYREWAKIARLKTGEQLWLCHHNHDTYWFSMLFDKSSAIMMFHNRIKFIHPTKGEVAGTAIGKCQSLIYIGDRIQDFANTFKEFGYILKTNEKDLNR